MKNQILGLVGMVAGAAALVVALSNKPAKVGYVETSVLMAQFTEAIKARKEFDTLKKGWDSNIKQINDSLLSTMNYMKQNYEKSSKKKQDEMRERLDKWNSDLNRYKQAVGQQAQEKEKELMEPVIGKVNSFLKTWGKQNGYSLIFGTMTGGNILQADETYNLTTTILKEINHHYKDLPTAVANDKGKVERKPVKVPMPKPKNKDTKDTIKN